MTTDELLRREVSELTTLLRSDPRWRDLREAVESQGLAVDSVVLGGFFEDEYEHEFGTIVAHDGTAFRFERSSAAGSVGFTTWERVRDVRSLLDTFPAILAAVEMVGSGSGPPRFPARK